MQVPPGFYPKDKAEDMACRLLKSIYTLKQAFRQCFGKIGKALLSFDFQASHNDYSMFTYSSQGEFTVLLVYVDDVVITRKSYTLSAKIKEFINAKFSIKDLRPLHFFLRNQGCKLFYWFVH